MKRSGKSPKPAPKPAGVPTEAPRVERPPAVADRAALVRHDPLARYMAEVMRHPLLSREEENELAWRYYKDPEHNVDAAYRLVTANLRLVVKIAHQYRRAAFSLLDLIQEGNIGLMQAVKKFDPGRGIKLSTYAAWWIRAYILRFVMDNFRMVKIGTTEAQRKLFFNLRKEQEKLLQRGIEAAPKLLAERLKVSEQDVVDMQGRLGQEEVSLDTPISEEGPATHLERMASGGQAADEALADRELSRAFHEKLQSFAAGLEGKERTVFEKRLVAEEPLTLQELGDQFGLTRERVRQIEAQLTRKLREYVAREMPDFGDVSLAKLDK
ncbi:MAG: sigma-70 family RNA polymerase sigma factor [Myxococcales bacterium]